jgi:hypothetical protein
LLCLAYLHHDPAVPEYENKNNEAKKYIDRVQRHALGLAGDGDRPLPLCLPAM